MRNTPKKKPVHVFSHVRDSWRARMRACVLEPAALIVRLRQLDWKQTDKKHLKQKKMEEGGKKKQHAHTTTCQEWNASNFFVIWQPFNKTRALCPHTPPSSHKRQRWREEKAGRRRGRRQTEHQMCLVPNSNHLTHLTFLSRLWFFLHLNVPTPTHPPSLPQTVEEQTRFLSIRGGRLIST